MSDKITDRCLLVERPHKSYYLGGLQRIYRLANGYGLSLVNSPKLRDYPFVWEAAVVKGVDDKGDFEGLVYYTPLTDDVEVFRTVEETNAFIDRAIAWGEADHER